MQITSVRLFLEVAEAGSISKVAARRQTVQSHISRQVSEFEQGVGAPLFRRTGRGVVLTELGERTAERLRSWLADTERLMAELRAASDAVLGEVRLGVIPTAAHPLMTRLYQRLQARHPGVRLNIVEAQGTELDALLDTGAVDLAILFRFSPPSGREQAALSVARTYLIAAPGDALTARPTVDFAALQGLRLVLPRRPSQWRNALDEAARSRGFTLDAQVQADSLTVQRQLVAHTPGLYSVLGPYAIAAELQAGRLQASRLVNPELSRHVVLATSRPGKASAACRVVAAELRQLVALWGDQLTEPGPDG